jgi:hypothetical protein
MRGSFCAFLDSNVLYPVSLRNLLLRLALAGLYRARWSADVHEEWIRAVLKDRPDIPRERLLDIRAAMDREAGDAIVTGYQPLIAGLTLPDPGDCHVLAAAIVGQADVIVTRNLRDFPDDALAPYEIEARHPDEFVRRLLDLAPVLVVGAVRDQQERLTNPPVSMNDLPITFERLGLVETVLELRQLMVG